MTRSTSRAGLDRLHHAMAARVANGELPGIVTLVAHADNVHIDTIGEITFASGDPMRRDTVFRITSMTKPILATATMTDEVPPVPGRYGWDGGYGTSWFNDPNRDLVAIAMAQTSDFLFNGGSAEFERLAVNS